MQQRINHQHMVNGVTIENPDNTFISPSVVIGQDTTIQSGVYLVGKVSIGTGNFIGANSVIENTTIGTGNHIESSKIIDSVVGNQTTLVLMLTYAVTQFSKIRPALAILLKSKRRPYKTASKSPIYPI